MRTQPQSQRVFQQNRRKAVMYWSGASWPAAFGRGGAEADVRL